MSAVRANLDMNERRKMESGDWFSTVFNVLIGVVLAILGLDSAILALLP